LSPEAKNIVMHPPTKAAKFEVKNRHKSAEEAKAKHFIYCYYFGSASKAIKLV